MPSHVGPQRSCADETAYHATLRRPTCRVLDSPASSEVHPAASWQIDRLTGFGSTTVTSPFSALLDACCHHHRPPSIGLLDEAAMKHRLSVLRRSGGEVLQFRPVTTVHMRMYETQRCIVSRSALWKHPGYQVTQICGSFSLYQNDTIKTPERVVSFPSPLSTDSPPVWLTNRAGNSSLLRFAKHVYVCVDWVSEGNFY